MPRVYVNDNLLERSVSLSVNGCYEPGDISFWSKTGLGAAYGLIALVALVQLVRIQLRVPEYGWTTQKVFHLLNCLVSSFRSATFLCLAFIFCVEPDSSHESWQYLALHNAPSLVFFTTYTLLVLFWAEIYYQARSIAIPSLRQVFVAINLTVYLVEGLLWGLSMEDTVQLFGVQLSVVGLNGTFLFLAAVALLAAAGFLLYGGRLFYMLMNFPIESRGRRRKMREVGLVTGICAACFILRAAMLIASSQLLCEHTHVSLDSTEHPIFNLVYYVVSEIVPSAAVLYILRKLPPPRNTQGYQQVPSQ